MILSGQFRLKKTVRPFLLQEWLYLSAGFSCLLLAARVIVTGSPVYLFLPWNLFLAFIPYWITGWLMKNVNIIESRFKSILAVGTWLLFIPNSFYIITDLFHLARIHSAPRWFDLLMIFSFAWNGLIAGILSVRRVEHFLSLTSGKPFSVLLVLVVMWLSAFGIYIGRFLRFNSWDVIMNPFALAGEILDLVIHPLRNGSAWGMTLCYAVFMTLVYFTIKKLNEYR